MRRGVDREVGPSAFLLGRGELAQWGVRLHRSVRPGPRGL